MVSITDFRNTINTRIFDALGSTGEVSYLTGSGTNDYGDEVSETWSSADSITIVPYSLMSNIKSYESFGDVNSGQVDIVFKYDQELEIGYRVKWNNNYYLVDMVEEFPLADGVLVKVARLSKMIV